MLTGLICVEQVANLYRIGKGVLFFYNITENYT